MFNGREPSLGRHFTEQCQIGHGLWGIVAKRDHEWVSGVATLLGVLLDGYGWVSKYTIRTPTLVLLKLDIDGFISGGGIGREEYDLNKPVQLKYEKRCDRYPKHFDDTSMKDFIADFKMRILQEQGDIVGKVRIPKRGER